MNTGLLEELPSTQHTQPGVQAVTSPQQPHVCGLPHVRHQIAAFQGRNKRLLVPKSPVLPANAAEFPPFELLLWVRYNHPLLKRNYVIEMEISSHRLGTLRKVRRGQSDSDRWFQGGEL